MDSSEYNYLKSGDKINGSDSVSEWYNLIDEHEWLYGDTIDYSIAVEFSGNSMYEIEHGEKETSHYVGIIGNIKEEQYVWTQKATGKINLMYLSDYFYSYYDGSTEESRGNARSYSVLKNSWIHFQKDGYNTNSNYEWLNLRWEIYSVNSFGVLAFGICSDGDWSRDSLIVLRGLRPVFYLSPKAKISDGNGTKTNPFRIEM